MTTTGPVERRVTALGRTFRTSLAGEGEPLVVFESGLGACGSVWVEVQRRVAAHTATLSYDRAGYVDSDPADDGRLLSDINRDLEAVLDALGHEGLVLLVGQSWGGQVVRSMAHVTRRPVAGIVLVDGSNSHVTTYEGTEQLEGLFVLLGQLAETDEHRPVRSALLEGVTWGLAPDDKDRVVEELLMASSTQAAAAEAVGLRNEAKAERLAELEAKGFPAGVPVVYLTAGLAMPVKEAEEAVAKNIAFQTEEARLRGARQVVVDSKHDIHLQDPGAVADAIIDLLQEVRGTATTGG